MAQAVPIAIYQTLEDRLGREDASKVVSAIEVSFESMERRAEAIAFQKKLEIEDDLTNKLVTKAEFIGAMNTLREETKGEIHILREETKGEIHTLRQEIQTVRQEIQTVRQEIQTVKVDLEGRIEAVKIGLEGRITRMDQKFNFVIILMILALTLMNPVVADLIKGYLSR